MTTNVVTAVKRAVANVLNPHDERVRRLTELQATQTAAAAARGRIRDAARRRKEEWEAPRLELERLEREEAGFSHREAEAVRAIELELQQNRRPALVAFERWCERTRPLLRPVPADVVRHPVTEESTVRNLAEVAARERAIGALVEATVACRDRLWRLPEAELRVTIQEFRQRIEADTADEMLEGELTAGRIGGL